MADIRDEWFRQDGKLVQKRSQDVEPYFDRNKRALADHDAHKARKSELREVADIPNLVYVQMMKLLGIPANRWFNMTDEEELRFNRMLNSGEYRHVRTSPGTLRWR